MPSNSMENPPGGLMLAPTTINSVTSGQPYPQRYAQLWINLWTTLPFAHSDLRHKGKIRLCLN